MRKEECFIICTLNSVIIHLRGFKNYGLNAKTDRSELFPISPPGVCMNSIGSITIYISDQKNDGIGNAIDHNEGYMGRTKTLSEVSRIRFRDTKNYGLNTNVSRVSITFMYHNFSSHI